jgi:hypothetical protein
VLPRRSSLWWFLRGCYERRFEAQLPVLYVTSSSELDSTVPSSLQSCQPSCLRLQRKSRCPQPQQSPQEYLQSAEAGEVETLRKRIEVIKKAAVRHRCHVPY